MCVKTNDSKPTKFNLLWEINIVVQKWNMIDDKWCREKVQKQLFIKEKEEEEYFIVCQIIRQG